MRKKEETEKEGKKSVRNRVRLVRMATVASIKWIQVLFWKRETKRGTNDRPIIIIFIREGFIILSIDSLSNIIILHWNKLGDYYCDATNNLYLLFKYCHRFPIFVSLIQYSNYFNGYGTCRNGIYWVLTRNFCIIIIMSNERRSKWLKIFQ